MEIFKALTYISIALAAILDSVQGQISTPCTTSMINSFTPCFNIITGSNNNGSSQTQTKSCCSTLGSLSGASMDCACLLLSANVPIPLPINTALTLILSNSCNITNLPAQCKAFGAPLPSPGTGPISLGPSPSPSPSRSLSPPTAVPAPAPLSTRASKAVAEAPAPQSETSSEPQPQTLAPSNPPVGSQAPTPTAHHRIRPVFTPSGSIPSHSCPPSLLLLLISVTVALMVLKAH